MAKYFGEIGYAEPDQVETAPGVWEDVIIERKLSGDVLRNNRRLNPAVQQANNDITVGVTLSVVADAYAQEHFFAIRYARWVGILWTVSTVDVESPRLLLTLGGVYNGPEPAITSDSSGDVDGEPD